MELKLRYRAPAEDSAKGWEEQSLPIGCGYIGANVFGIVERERVQITENSLENPGSMGGLNNFAKIYIHFPHTNVQDYERVLDLDHGVAYCRYSCNGVEYTREYFASYPDRCLVVHLTASTTGKLDFVLSPEIPFVKDFDKTEGDGGAKHGTIVSDSDGLLETGHMDYYNIDFSGRFRVVTDGGTQNSDGRIAVAGATEATIIFAAATNYILSPDIFLTNEHDKKLKALDTVSIVNQIADDAVALGYNELRRRHIADYSELFGRVSFVLDDADDSAYCDELLEEYKAGRTSRYLELLLFQYGRYLLISSSRPGTLPANLQGVWNCHDHSPWGSGYWHNINVQMNYWPAFSTNLAETFVAYKDFNEAFRPAAARAAEGYIRHWNPENLVDNGKAPLDNYGWTIGTASYPYTISSPGGHSGPGTGGLTTKLFADWYDFTQDKDALRDSIYPALATMSRFLTRTVRDYDGELLASFSASPEQLINGHYAKSNIYYNTVGCSFDQQMIYENGADMLRFAELVGIDDDDTKRQREQIAHYSPVLVGWSGQIKEYREENLYGEIGEYKHRHISQLVGLFPGTLINSETPAWMDAAKLTLNERGDESTGWALAHRLNAWARTGDGNRAYKLYSNILALRTYSNLWTYHPPFQIDCSFGATSGVAEMLLQSHEGYLAPLAALPDAWESGEYHGLVGRGGYEVSARWQAGQAVEFKIIPKRDGICRVKYGDMNGARVYCGELPVEVRHERYDLIAFDCEAGKTYTIVGMTRPERAPQPVASLSDDNRTISWTQVDGCSYTISRAYDNDSKYTVVASGLTSGNYTDTDSSKYDHVTYRLTAAYGKSPADESLPAVLVGNHATKLYLERYRHILRQLDSLK